MRNQITNFLKRNSQFLAVFAFTALLFTSCETDEFTEFEAFADTDFVLGKEYRDPYAVESMQEIVDEIAASESRHAEYAKKFTVEATHYYYKFMPKNQEQVDLLIEMHYDQSYYPRNHTIEKHGTYYNEPGKPLDTPPYMYTVLQKGEKLPIGVEYELISELFLPLKYYDLSGIHIDEDDVTAGQRVSKKTAKNFENESFLKDLETKSYQASGLSNESVEVIFHFGDGYDSAFALPIVGEQVTVYFERFVGDNYCVPEYYFTLITDESGEVRFYAPQNQRFRLAVNFERKNCENEPKKDEEIAYQVKSSRLVQNVFFDCE